MKKKFYVLLCTMLMLMVVGCGNSGNSDRTVNGIQSVEDVLQERTTEQDSQEANAVEEAETGESTESFEVVTEASMEEFVAETNTNEKSAQDEVRQNGLSDNAPEPETDISEDAALSNSAEIDVDLTSLSSTMVYSEVYNMISDPYNYLGKTIKMDGLFTVYHDESMGNNYYACIIQDATACCAQGIEFVLTDDYSYPDDYPAEGSEITVVGEFSTYMEDEYQYCTLNNAILY